MVQMMCRHWLETHGAQGVRGVFTRSHSFFLLLHTSYVYMQQVCAGVVVCVLALLQCNTWVCLGAICACVQAKCNTFFVRDGRLFCAGAVNSLVAGSCDPELL